jgi:hypothetical protein
MELQEVQECDATAETSRLNSRLQNVKQKLQYGYFEFRKTRQNCSSESN